MRDKLKKKVYSVIINNSSISEGILLLQRGENANLEKDLGYNSIDFISLLTELEQKFEVEIPNELLLNDVLTTSDGIYKTIYSLKEGKTN